MFGHPLSISDGSDCTKAPGLHNGAASAHLCADALNLDRDKPFGIQERREGASSGSLLKSGRMR